jgi:2-polyprenyl-6-hydroxyphenyl methylase/3-demethylubiquinone-9 3-methyltransferase
VGEIDEDATRNGTIVCKDGFRASTVRPEEFRVLSEGLGMRMAIDVVEGSSLFCEITV